MSTPSTPLDLSRASWKKSTHSTSEDACVEVALMPGVPGAAAVRDSKDADGPVLTFGAPAWRALLGQLKENCPT